jgi:hypothetical protein
MQAWCEREQDAPATLVVCGAGAAGIATAISAACGGAEVWLLETRPRIGGTVTHSLIHTLAGLYDSHGNLLNEGLCGELVERLQHADSSVRMRRLGRTWVLNCPPRTYAQVVDEWLAETRQLHVVCGAAVSRLAVSRHRIEAVEISSNAARRRIVPLHVVDATGSAEVVRRLDASLVDDAPDACAGGLIYTMRGVSPEVLQFPGSLRVLRELRQRVQRAQLPPECTQTWIDSGTEPDEVYVKLMVPMRDRLRHDIAHFKHHARRNARLVLQVLRDIPGFENTTLERVGELGVRDGGRIRGEYRLTVADVRAGRRFRDAACRCEWPIEFWHPDRGVSLEYLNAAYEIPLRCLKVVGFANLWAAGKCLSADRDAHASARVVGSCWAMGDALGKALSVEASVTHVESR